MTPRQVVELWIDRFNAADVAGLAELYHADAINHQVTQEPVHGRDEIRAMFERQFRTADMVGIPEAIHEAGEVVALEWRDPAATAAVFARPGRRPFAFAENGVMVAG